ncbi:MAG: aminoacetone oxidase family FAD-binding enzyme [Lachnospiraceae bacterium]|nr:aminoacetone oxidase family FAD-binding enzyme [Lachnospiraceae bacterium]
MAERRIAIIGGGAAGLAAAITAARRGASVTILEHKDRVGKKILATGNGRCNYTNAVMHSGCFYANDTVVVEQLLKTYPTERILSFFEEIGVVPSERDGYYYPASGQAAAVLDCLRAECDRLGVDIRCETEVLAIQPVTGGFRIKTRPMENIKEDKRGGSISNLKVDRVLLCCGGQASPVTGSDGSGYDLAFSLGHKIHTPFPALTGLKADPKRFKPLAGIRAKACASLYVEGKAVKQEIGELQLTENGLSGIVIFQLSHPSIQAYLQKRKTEIHINFLPEMQGDEVFPFLRQRRDMLGHKELQEWGVGLFHKKLWLQICKEAGLPLMMPASQLDNRGLSRLQAVITDFTVPITGYLGYDRAQVTAGGVDLREITANTFQSKKVPGLYFAGEILDVDGICGGYNLHFAWASGMAAAEAACR